MKRILYYATCAVTGLCLLAATSACTGNFENINKRETTPSSTDLTLAERVGVLFAPMIERMHNPQENNSQMIDQMVGNTYGGYMNCTNNFGNGGNYNTLDPRSNWTENTYQDQFAVFYRNYNQVLELTEGKGYITAWADIMKVYVMLRIADTYGPIPYSKMSPEVTLTPYDSVQDLYHNMIKTLTDAIAEIRDDKVGAETPMAPYDIIYNGDFNKWIKFANTLKLRLAVRIALKDEVYSKGVIAEVLADPTGPLFDNADNAAMIPVSSSGNPYWLAGQQWGDLSISATLSTYMNGLNDPRISAFMTELNTAILDEQEEKGNVVPGKSALSTYIGVWMGADCDDPNGARALYAAFSDPGPKDGKSWDILLLNAAETHFLLAEAALRGWIEGGDAKAKEYYETGIRTSIQQWGASVGDYMSASITEANGGYIDPVHPTKSFNIVTAAGGVPINVAWDANTTTERKIEAIITQKWIANFTLGFEAWSEFRRTGYPRMFPSARNLSADVSNADTDIITTNAVRMVRRLPYPRNEYTSNATNVAAAVSMLGGTDAVTTELWWAKGNQ